MDFSLSCLDSFSVGFWWISLSDDVLSLYGGFVLSDRLFLSGIGDSLLLDRKLSSSSLCGYGAASDH